MILHLLAALTCSDTTYKESVGACSMVSYSELIFSEKEQGWNLETTQKQVTEPELPRNTIQLYTVSKCSSFITTPSHHYITA